ncbi:replication protein A 32 kDa subunit-like [Dysidea avara]|uniref:replication protein A 32 kDa subunit-like n=1 Tax=Dysidea avara TaxID=196820 RepID=UPI00331E643A
MNFAGGGYQSSYGGGGGMASSGGGYLQNYGITSPNILSPEKKGRSAGQSQSILPVTSAMIQAATPSAETFMLDDIEINQVTFVGEIMEVVEAQTNVIYKVDDRTGPWITVQKWLEEQENEAEIERRAECREGIYVRVAGHLRSFKQQKSVVVFSIRPIVHFNEVTSHLMETLQSYLCLKKGPIVPAAFAAGQTSNSWSAPGTSSSSMATPSYMGARMESGLSGVQQKVLNCISGSMVAQGMHIQDVIQTVSRQGCSEAQIREAVEFLCNEGHVYSTIDYDHYKSTDT